MMRRSLALILMFWLSWAQASVKSADDVKGTWYIDMHQTLKEVGYKEGPRYFDYKGIKLEVNDDATSAEVVGIEHEFFSKGFDATIRQNKLVLERKKSLLERAADKASGDDKFNYTKQKILVFSKKDRLIAKVRPDKGEKEMELVFTRNPSPKAKKDFKVKYDTLYLSEDPIKGKRWELTFDKSGRAQLVTHKGIKSLPYIVTHSKKVFLGEGEYLVKSFSKALNVYSVEEDEMFAFFPVR